MLKKLKKFFDIKNFYYVYTTCAGAWIETMQFVET